MFEWTNPWHTDILTLAQKLKRKLFTARLLRLSEEALLRLISRWLFTDEKWWDIVGPAASKYCKGATKMERKLQNQVCIFCVCLLLFFLVFAKQLMTGSILLLVSGCTPQEQERRHKKKGILLGRHLLVLQNTRSSMDRSRLQSCVQAHEELVCWDRL